MSVLNGWVTRSLLLLILSALQLLLWRIVGMAQNWQILCPPNSQATLLAYISNLKDLAKKPQDWQWIQREEEPGTRIQKLWWEANGHDLLVCTAEGNGSCAGRLMNDNCIFSVEDVVTWTFSCGVFLFSCWVTSFWVTDMCRYCKNSCTQMFFLLS